MDSTRIMAVINRIRYGVINTHVWSLLTLIIVALNSCASISLNNDFKRIASKFTFHYTGEDTGIDSVLNINGFFYDSLHINYDSNIMFFKNGLVVEGIVDSKRLDEKKTWTSHNIFLKFAIIQLNTNILHSLLLIGVVTFYMVIP